MKFTWGSIEKKGHCPQGQGQGQGQGLEGLKFAKSTKV